MTQLSQISKHEIMTALDVISIIADYEGDSDHVSILTEVEEVVRMVTQEKRPKPSEDELQTTQRVLEAIKDDAANSYNHSHIETYMDEGLMFTQIFSDIQDNP